MTLISMTGFARSEDHSGNTSFAWEVKSVNGKAFDLRLRLPQGFDHLESAMRALFAQNFKRGSLQVNLTLQEQSAESQIEINHAVLDRYVSLAEGLRHKLGAAPLSVESLLSLKGVIENQTPKRDDAAQAELEKSVMQSLEKAVKGLVQSRGSEGEKIHALIADQLDQITSLHAAATAHPARQKDAIKVRLKNQIAELMDMAKLDENRLTQEVVMAFTKADIQEELDRLSVHISAARDLLNAKEPVGRKFDFLTQEFNREANTLCSKSNDAGLTQIGLQLKTVIDQLREQVQNIE